MILQVMSRADAETWTPPTRHFKAAIISISTPGHSPAKLYDVPALHLVFHDLDSPYHKVPLFNEEQASQIWTFVSSLKDIELLIIHCDAGISRSPAVAAAIAFSRGENPGNYFNRYLPNRWVYRVMLKVYADQQRQEKQA